MSLRQFQKLVCKPIFANQHRPFSITAICSNTLGYGDLWDDAHNCPDHGHFKDDPDKSQAGESINMDSGMYAQHVTDDYDASMDEVDAVLRQHDENTRNKKSNQSAQHETDTGNSRPATGYN
ncbi:hypothetical protein INT44_008535 [Umbelopsis vinacea]|uniref:Uncharacterized protein n=1 Tax=Umbelopsis vinacea TaxID=44442 RepID=A0A8H7PXI0_9FUNG|nr:hypothetical protein INT44_008535 [Umbelopsis vinacea]